MISFYLRILAYCSHNHCRNNQISRIANACRPLGQHVRAELSNSAGTNSCWELGGAPTPILAKRSASARHLSPFAAFTNSRDCVSVPDSKAETPAAKGKEGTSASSPSGCAHRLMAALNLIHERQYLLENRWRSRRDCRRMPWHNFREDEKRHERHGENKRKLRC